MNQLDVLAIGLACWDLNFQVDRAPGPNEKTKATSLISEGGGPAANAAYCISKLGGKAAFMGRLGNDHFGNAHLDELRAADVQVDRILRSDSPTSIASVTVNQNGDRSVVNYSQKIESLTFDFSNLHPKCILIDGHEWDASEKALQQFSDIPSVLDAGSFRDATQTLAGNVSHLVASSSFAIASSGSEHPDNWFNCLLENTPHVAITRGEQGVVWKTTTGEQGSLKGHSVATVDTTAAGDVFHGSFSLALSRGNTFKEALAWANRVAAISTTKPGGRSSCPASDQVPQLNVCLSAPNKP